MLVDGISLIEGSSATNLTVVSGADFPVAPNTGELFFKTGIGSGLYAYDGTDWALTGSSGGGSSFTISGDVAGVVDGGSGVLTLNTVNGAPGALGSASAVSAITVNAKGLVTAGTTTPIAIATSQVTSGTFADARISQANVTQHQAALALQASQITSGTFADARISETSVTQHLSSLAIAESQITDGTIFARLASSENITGAWQFVSGSPSTFRHVNVGRTAAEARIAVAATAGDFLLNMTTGDVAFYNVGATNTYVGTAGAGDLILSTNNADRLRITSSGSVDFSNRYTENRVAVTATTTTTLNCASANIFVITMSANITTLVLSNVPASGRVYSLTMFFTQDGTGGRSIAWPASVKFSGGSAPVLTGTALKTDIVNFVTYDGGTTWYGLVVGLNF